MARMSKPPLPAFSSEIHRPRALIRETLPNIVGMAFITARYPEPDPFVIPQPYCTSLTIHGRPCQLFGKYLLAKEWWGDFSPMGSPQLWLRRRFVDFFPVCWRHKEGLFCFPRPELEGWTSEILPNQVPVGAYSANGVNLGYIPL